MRGLLQIADEKRQVVIAELSAKQQKVKMRKDASSIPFFCCTRTQKEINVLYFVFVFFQQIESFEAQLADALADRSKAAETISSLQVRAV